MVSYRLFAIAGAAGTSVAVALAACSSDRLLPANLDAGDHGAEPPVQDGGAGDASSLVISRPYALYLPDGGPPVPPLVVMLHGYSATGVTEESSYFHLIPTSDEHGFLYAYPNGTSDCDGQLSWNATDACCRFCSPPVDDVAYLTAMLADIHGKTGSDPKRTYLIGHSNGGYMAHRFACDRASRVAAIVSYAGAQWADAGLCAPTEPVSVVQIHGDQDTGANYTTGYDGGSTSSAAYPSAHETVAIWARKNGCTGMLADTGQRLDLVSTLPGNETKIEAYQGCPNGIDVELWTVQGGGHMDPLSLPSFGNAVWAFMNAHKKP